MLNTVFLLDLGVSENSVPLNPMVNDHYPLFHWEYTLFSDKPIYCYFMLGACPNDLQPCWQVVSVRFGQRISSNETVLQKLKGRPRDALLP